MILALNLIPPEYNDRFRLERVYALLKNIIILTILYTIFLAILILMARYILQRNFNRIVDETTLVTRENKDVESKIVAFNKEISSVKEIQKNNQPWVDSLINITGLIPDGVSLTALKLEAGPSKSSLSGRATTREALLDLKSRLEGALYLKDITLPVTDLLTRTDVDFTINFTTDPAQVPKN